MTISAELQTRYSSEVDVDWAEALWLYHPSAGHRYLIDYHQEYEGRVEGSLQLFTPVPFALVLPTRDDSGRQDMSIVFGNIQREAQSYIDAAATDGTQPILCNYSVFIIGDQDPQIEPWIAFSLTDIAVTEQSVTATASSTDILNRAFPSEVYRVDRYPGLTRR